MNPAEVAVDERVSGLGLLRGSLGQPEVPLGVLIPRMRGEVLVLLVGGRLDLPPVAVEHVLPGFDQLAGARHRAIVDGVGSHGRSLTAPLPSP